MPHLCRLLVGVDHRWLLPFSALIGAVLLTATDVLKVVASAIPVEAAEVMATADGSEPPIWKEFAQLLPGTTLDPLERFAFYDAASDPSVALVIATGEQRIYANILLTIGVVMPE